MRDSSVRVARLLFAVAFVLAACSIDVSKLRGTGRRDAAEPGEVGAHLGDAATASDVVVADEGGSETGADAHPEGPTYADIAVDVFDEAGAEADGADKDGCDVAVERSPEDSAPGLDEAADEAGRDATEDAADAPTQTWDAAVADEHPGGADGPGDLAAADVAADTQSALSVDARGKKTCPTSISGSLDRTDSTQVGRLSRTDSASACGTTKEFPGNGADTTYSHLYDVYHFINATSAPACLTFTLTYSQAQELYAVAYATFDPRDITDSYLGDVGDKLSPPQTMGLTVGAGASFDVVVSAVALGTDPAGSYTLSCSTQ